MFDRFFSKRILLAVLVTASIFSCKSPASSIYGTNKKVETNVIRYLNVFKQHDIDVDKVYFLESDSIININYRVNFLRLFHRNSDYFYFGTAYTTDSTFFFKQTKDKKYGCKEVYESIRNENEFPFHIDGEFKELLSKYKFSTVDNNPLIIKDKKTVILLYHHSMGRLFFKDTKDIRDYASKNKGIQYIILSTDSYDFKNKRFLPS
ncbi:hypothetical protein HYN48_03540 [Flavobacterium magnum]|uniref:Lipoprotein n=1 Tax=Flavobacterium magnum TaxID=2162713 RepID=A0A2S0RCC6_9FLAO|nr:hypothetical protein [Flavobacterium magnum]AWA29234.1 hypothetical protein HYN48_03540 [Flavobacterium magnum]